MKLTVHSGISWNDHEMQHLDNLVTLLKARGHVGESVIGASDDGDPYFAFVTHGGNTLLHIARIGAVYVMDGDFRDYSEAETLERLVEPLVKGRMAA